MIRQAFVTLAALCLAFLIEYLRPEYGASITSTDEIVLAKE